MFLNLTSSYWYTYVWMSRTCFASKLINSYFCVALSLLKDGNMPLPRHRARRRTRNRPIKIHIIKPHILLIQRRRLNGPRHHTDLCRRTYLPGPHAIRRLPRRRARLVRVPSLRLAVVRLFDPEGAHGGQVDGDDCEVEFQGDDDDGLAEAVGCVEVGQQREQCVEADCAHDDGCAAEGEDGDDGKFLAQGHLEFGKDGDGQDEDVEIEQDILSFCK
jgi:hypothetical protein